MATSTIHTCKNCGNQFTGKYCNVCGEKVYTDHDKSIAHFLEDALHFITHLEGTLITTLKTILTKPGRLSYDYCHGIRKKYFKPLSFFMLLVILYLLFPFFTGLNMPFRFYLNRGAKATQLVSHRIGIDIDSIQQGGDTVIADRTVIPTVKIDRDSRAYTDSVLSNTPAFVKLERSFSTGHRNQLLLPVVRFSFHASRDPDHL